jgi:uncharacterized protein YegP (UPF0339 family)
MNDPCYEVFPRLRSGRMVWYWRFRAGNGQVFARSSESYVSSANAIRAVNDFLDVQRRGFNRIKVVSK